MAENFLGEKNEEIIKETMDHIKVNDILIDGKSSDDVGELVIKDREMLSENGIVLISATLSKRQLLFSVAFSIWRSFFINTSEKAVRSPIK